MGMVVQHNMNAINAYNRLNANVAGLKKASEKLSSGYRINRAGDDAAGLAVSEKMRSQIKGLNQAIRNSQDGINMIQTFEGAAQETHSILQRMKELATQSANGTYDNATDRAAMQLEFDQLNDELNQIADTDFNGTIVLNGGEMSDGLKAVVGENGLGEFNYGDKAAQDEAAAKAAAEAKAADAALVGTAEDICGDADGIKKVLANDNYGKTDADKIWEKLGLTPESVDAAKPDELQITFTYDGSAWKATGVMKKNAEGKLEKVDVAEDKLAALATQNVGNGDGAGGFKIKDTSLNMVFDTHDVQKYDYATISVQNLKGANFAPKNADVLEDSWTIDVANVTKGDHTKADATVAVTLTDDGMSADIKKALDTLKDTEIEFKYVTGAGAVSSKVEVTVAADATNGIKGGTLTIATDGSISYKDANNVVTNIGNITFSNGGDTNLALTGGKFKVNLDSYQYVDTSTLKANNVATDTAMKPKAGMFEDPAAAEADRKVSNSDAFGKSKAILNYADNITLQTGARTKDAVNFTFNYNVDKTADMGDLDANLNLSSREGGLETAGLKLSTQEDANHAIDQIDKAINKTSLVRASFGAIQNRLEHKITNLTTTSENLTEAESSIRDTDMASEMMNYTKFNILQQAAQSMLAQANQQPQSILQLLG